MLGAAHRSGHRIRARIGRPTAASPYRRLSASIRAAPVRRRRRVDAGVGRGAAAARSRYSAFAPSPEWGFGLGIARVMVGGFGLRIQAAIASSKAPHECEASHQKQPAGAHHPSTTSMSPDSPDQVSVNRPRPLFRRGLGSIDELTASLITAAGCSPV
jgi:hypothetical protein